MFHHHNLSNLFLSLHSEWVRNLIKKTDLEMLDWKMFRAKVSPYEYRLPHETTKASQVKDS